MTVDEIKTQIENKLGLDFENDEIIDVFNEGLVDLAEVLRLETIAYASLTAEHKTVTWPTDVFELHMVKLEKSGELRRRNIDDDSKGYQVYGGEIHFGDTLKPPDTCTLHYYRYPSIIESVSDVPDLPVRFSHALKYYFIVAYQQEDEELQLEEDYLRKYYRVKEQIDRHTRKQKGMHRTRKARMPLWR